MIGMGSQSLILLYREKKKNEINHGGGRGGEIREVTLPQGKSHKQIYPAFCYHLSGIYVLCWEGKNEKSLKLFSFPTRAQQNGFCEEGWREELLCH